MRDHQSLVQEARLLLRIQGLFFFAISLGGIFLNVFLFRHGGFHAVIVYNIISIIAILLFFVITGLLLRRFSFRDIMRVGLGAHVLLYVLLFLFREESMGMLPVLGVLNGIGTGLFWAVMNISQYMFTTSEVRQFYLGRQNFWAGITQGLAPLFGGVIITLAGMVISHEMGYSVIFLLIAVLLAATYVEAAKLPHGSGITFFIRDISRHKRTAGWIVSLVQHFFYGFFDFPFSAFSVVLLFLILKEEVLLGIVNAVGMVIGGLAALAAGLMLGKKPQRFAWGAFGGCLGIGLFAFQQNGWGILALTLLFKGAMPFLNIAASTSVYDMIDAARDTWQRKFHFFLEQEIALNTGRGLSFALFFMIAGNTGQTEAARTWLFVLALMPLLIGVCQRFIYRTENKKPARCASLPVSGLEPIGNRSSVPNDRAGTPVV